MLKIQKWISTIFQLLNKNKIPTVYSDYDQKNINKSIIDTNMISDVFQKWLKSFENKADQTAYSYTKSIAKISKHYSEQIGKNVDLYSLTDLGKLKDIAEKYGKLGKYSKFGELGNGTNRAAINALCRFRESNLNLGRNIVITEESISNEVVDDDQIVESPENNVVTNFSYEKDLKNAMIFQINDLFPEYKIFGIENEGVEYLIEGKRIDILLEKIDGSLLAVELKTGCADFRVFGQISMYLGLLSDRFPDKLIRGCIIAGEIDTTLRSAVKTSDKIDLMTYSMKLELNKE